MTEPSDEDAPRPPAPVPAAIWPHVADAAVPRGIAVVAGSALVGAAGLAMVGAGISAATFTIPSPTDAYFGSPGNALTPSFALLDRLALFAQTGSNLLWGVMLALGVAIVVFSRGAIGGDSETDPSPQRIAMVALVLSAVVMVTNLAMCIAVLARVEFNPFVRDYRSVERAAQVVELLAPATLAWGVLWYATSWLRGARAGPRTDDD